MSEYEEMVQAKNEAREEEQWNMPADDWDASYSWCCEFWPEYTQSEMISIMEYSHDIDTDDLEDKSFDDVESTYFKIANDEDNENLVNNVGLKVQQRRSTVFQ